mmetsp:Transcript_107557/g.190512  ORF Transcript_107557/g.190512 Transcript_107557/m.190512 type:complete len:128 (+) Transcript_107557:1-384(+)
MFSGWSYTTIIINMGVLSPAFSYFGVKASEQGVRAFTDILPMISRVIIKIKREQDELPKKRADLQARIRRCVKQCGPVLGNLYYEKDVDWSEEMKPSGGSWQFPLPEDLGAGRMTTQNKKLNRRKTD